ncbi:MAG: hypothetical protein E6H10_06430 [Bacteroidetes bacterium]|nr:MAG: hypothetical protein E6H10_06430 [Bacteroidota bacterium]
MSLRYWVKNDYINSPSDTSLDGAIMKHGVTIDNNNIRNIYMGRWTVNFDDSTLKFIFDDGKFSFPGIEGKYVELGSTSMNLQKVVFFDSTIAGKNVNLKKVITTYLTH